MFRASLIGAGALCSFLVLTDVAHAQCGYVPCALYLYAPAIGGTMMRMGASPGAFGTGVGMVYQSMRRNPPSYPPGVWRPQYRYSGPPVYRSPYVWAPQRRW
jgi:hypothetical protein